MLTVALSTRNRASLLRRTLEGMTCLFAPANTDWELIVVDNNCTDDTASVVDEFRCRLPIRRIREVRSGVSNGRNAAVAEARGSHIVLTDDDVLVDPMWLANYAAAFSAYPDDVVFGGPIIPWFSATPPSWLLDALDQIGEVYGQRDFGADDLPLQGAVVPYGANMAFRLDVLGDAPFDPRLGRKGGGMLAGEEIHLIGSLLAAGHTGRWVAAARVQHCVRPDQLSVGFLRRYYVGAGATSLLLSPTSTGAMLFGRPRWMWRRLVETEVAYRLHRLYAPPERWVQDLKEASTTWGQIRSFRPQS